MSEKTQKNIQKDINEIDGETQLIEVDCPISFSDPKIEKGLGDGGNDARTMICTITTSSLDREGDRIMARGIRGLQKQIPLLWAHQHDLLPVGKSLHMKYEGGEKVIGKFKYANHQLANDVYELAKEGFIRTVSVGFRADSKGMKLNSDGGRDIQSGEIMECSLVNIPANPEATIDAMKSLYKSGKLMISKDMAEELMIVVMDDGAQEIEIVKDVEEEKQVESEIKTETEKAIMGSEDKEITCLTIKELEDDTSVIWIDKDDPIITKPFPNEHACRKTEPNYDKYARKNCYIRHAGKCIDVIFGIKDGKSEIQTYRYPKSKWDVASARAHCKSHNGSFEPASGEEKNYDDALVDIACEDELNSELNRFMVAYHKKFHEIINADYELKYNDYTKAIGIDALKVLHDNAYKIPDPLGNEVETAKGVGDEAGTETEKSSSDEVSPDSLDADSESTPAGDVGGEITIIMDGD